MATCLLFSSQMLFAAQSENSASSQRTVIPADYQQSVTGNNYNPDQSQLSLPLGIRNNPQDFSDKFPEVPREWTVVDPQSVTPIHSNDADSYTPGTTKASTIPAVTQVETPYEQDSGSSENSLPTQAEAASPDKGRTEQPTEIIAATGPPDVVEVPEDWIVTVISSTGGELLVPDPIESVASDESIESEESPSTPIPDAPPIVQMANGPVDFEGIDPEKLGSRRELPHQLILNDEPYPKLKAYETEKGQMLLPLTPIAGILGDSFSIDEAASLVKYVRSRDGARFELNTETGEVLANGNKVGFLNEVGLVDADLGLFPANAIQVFSGLHIKRDDDEQIVSMTLDKRLQYVSGFELYVNGQLLPFLNPEPRSLGHVLLLPLRAIVDELGSRLEISPDNNQVTVIRYQDNARISMNLTTGLIEVDGNPVGTAPNIAYADRNQLLLPKESVASLTGTYITIPPGSRRIDVDLDGQLARIIHPGDSIQARAASSPPSVESAKLFYDSENRASAVVRGHYSTYNLKFEYETPTTQGDDGFTPEWMQLFAESIDGWGLGVGDHSTQRRELSGVNASRIKGAYFYNPLKDGVLVATLGEAQNGSRQLDGGDNVPTFGGEVGGVRYYSNDGKFEAGIAARNDDDLDTKAVVASSFKVFDQPDFKLGELYQRTEVVGGVYEEQGDSKLGGRLAWDGRLEPTDQLSLSARTDYSSAELAGEVESLEITGEDIEIIDADRLSYGLGLNYRPHQRLAYGLGHSRTERGIIDDGDSDELDIWTESSTASVSLKPFVSSFSPWTYFSWNRSTASDDEKIRRLSGQAVWRFDKYSFLFKHEDQRAEESGSSWLTSLQISRDAWIKYFTQSSNIKFSPRFNAWKNSDSLNANVGALLSYNSGKLLGKSTQFGMSYGRNLGVQVLENSSDEEDDDTFLDGNDYFNANLTYRFNRLVKFSSNYYSDLDGSDNVYASLTAYYEFNPPRNIKLSRENAGLLTGQVFLDENHDGKQQESEKGIPGARVTIKGTRLALNADPNGRFTIQNLPVGVYRIVPDVSRMPLGYMGDPNKISPVRIGDSLITEMKIPVVQGNQLHGVVYIDRNSNGTLDIEDERLENIGLELAHGQETASTVFGQFSFDYLPPGDYEVSVQDDTLPDGISVDPEQTLTTQLSGGGRSRFLIRLIERATDPPTR